MRVAILVAVVAVHVILFLFFPSLWRRAAQGEEPLLVPIFLPRVAVRPVPKQQPGGRGRAAPQTQQSRVERAAPEEEAPPGEVSNLQQAQPEPMAPAPDWRMQAQESAQHSAQQIVAAEDAAKRQANALTARFKPLAPDRVRGPEFGWSVATHRIAHLPGGGLAYNLNDHCQLVIFPMLFAGCSIGKIEANGDLFKYMRPPLKFGDWDKRDADP